MGGWGCSLLPFTILGWPFDEAGLLFMVDYPTVFLPLKDSRIGLYFLSFNCRT